MSQTCTRCGSVLVWAHGQLVCPRRGCGRVRYTGVTSGGSVVGTVEGGDSLCTRCRNGRVSGGL